MRVLVLGGDGYLGWPTAVHLSDCGHTVGIADNFARRNYDHELGVESLVPVHPLHVRVAAWSALSGRQIDAFCGDITDAAFTRDLLSGFRPHAVVHFAEQRSAPYSMIDQGPARLNTWTIQGSNRKATTTT
jgi:UDP-sulfoquinovose synthase